MMDEEISSMNKMYESKVRIIIKEKVLAYRVSSLWSKFQIEHVEGKPLDTNWILWFRYLVKKSGRLINSVLTDVHMFFQRSHGASFAESL